MLTDAHPVGTSMMYFLKVMDLIYRVEPCAASGLGSAFGQTKHSSIWLHGAPRSSASYNTKPIIGASGRRLIHIGEIWVLMLVGRNARVTYQRAIVGNGLEIILFKVARRVSDLVLLGKDNSGIVGVINDALYDA